MRGREKMQRQTFSTSANIGGGESSQAAARSPVLKMFDFAELFLNTLGRDPVNFISFC